MEAAAPSIESRALSGERAQRIVDAMRASVARRGAAASTFEHVAREADVSRGLLHYYFQTKERLLVEVVRRECDLRMSTLTEALEDAHTADDFIDVLVRSLEDIIENDPDFYTLLFEMFTLGRRNPEIGRETADLYARLRAHVAELLRAKEAEGALALGAEPEAVAGVMFALGDGVALQLLTDPKQDHSVLVGAAATGLRRLLADAS
ncbi:MAG TPA: TetR/AcrR family transcriptional regulator [Solirubrobacteraceae bacterium]|nr:TetR/AcrR family transcriptional regulator [Solirubrobacteraceae bacterium]